MHYWLIEYETLDRSGRPATNVFLHGFQAFPNGSIIVISFERLCAFPHESLHRIFEEIGGHTPDLEPRIQLFKEAKELTETDMFSAVLVAEPTSYVLYSNATFARALIGYVTRASI